MQLHDSDSPLNMLEIIRTAQVRSKTAHYDPLASKDYALFESLANAVAEAIVAIGDGTAGSQAATFETTVTVSGNVSGSFASFWTASSGNNLGGMYKIYLYIEVTGTTIPSASAMATFELQWTSSGLPQTTSVGLDLSGDGGDRNTDFHDPTTIDDATDVEWKYDIAGWTSDTCTLKMKATVVRLA